MHKPTITGMENGWAHPAVVSCMMIWDGGALTRAPRQQTSSQKFHARMCMCIFLHVLLQTSRAKYACEGTDLYAPARVHKSRAREPAVLLWATCTAAAKLLTACNTSEVCDQAAGKFRDPI